MSRELKNLGFGRRLGFALAGIAVAFKSEQSFRTQCVFAAGAGVLLAVLRPAPVWWALLALTVGSVLALELVNTALEFVVDRLHPEQHPMIARAKDCAAGAVLLMSAASLAVGLALVWDWVQNGHWPR
jgi:diacylglycerol kinase (ATP)